ncbi:hypothetical protein D7B24_001668 [Verticillium nonalfalfae]|uniref:Uncharacterized protein n=1 Tax=Verticillium nonalfalfae TaxID=1051616 RepID=A0A3M9Y353_9PEZI|nr:uncharacterized protein D7B24_001668 [Verticillium nonalfalfae]RNJ53570.1 hypothetical protein D7B24_001668 [Verticillium nonalfalfae]
MPAPKRPEKEPSADVRTMRHGLWSTLRHQSPEPSPDSKRAFGTLELPGGPATVGSVAMDVTVVTLVTVDVLTDTGQVVVCGMGVVVGVVVGVTVVVLGLRHAQALDTLAALPPHPDA